jgi:hypothetical protein
VPMTGPFKRLPAMAREIEKLGKPGSPAQKAIARAAVVAVRGVLTHQFATGTGPDGKPWKFTKRRKPALVSKKLPRDFAGVPVAKGAAFFSRIPWLIAHHRGHVFAARTQVLTFSAKGKLLSGKRQRRAKIVFDTRANVGPRTLPERPVYPDRMTDVWGKAINAGVGPVLGDIGKKITQG